MELLQNVVSLGTDRHLKVSVHEEWGGDVVSSPEIFVSPCILKNLEIRESFAETL
jgi:hypothetical protein